MRKTTPLRATLFLVSVIVSAVPAATALAVAFPPNGPWPDRITYFVSNDGSFTRSSAPMTTANTSQTKVPGQITVSISNTTGYTDSGFVVYAGKLGDISTLSVPGVGSGYSINLWFDKDNDGEFFTWSGNVLTGLGADTYGLGTGVPGGTYNVDGSTTFFMMTPPNGNPTLNQLKAGAFPGITADTNVAIWVGVSVTGPKSTSFSYSVSDPMPVYRFFNLKNGSHFYTASEDEKRNVMATLSGTYKYEFVAYTIDRAEGSATQNLYRFFIPARGTHFYTADPVERDWVISNLWRTYKYEGVAYQVVPAGVPKGQLVYRFFRPASGTHFYSADATERDWVISKLFKTYTYEFPAFRVNN